MNQATPFAVPESRPRAFSFFVAALKARRRTFLEAILATVVISLIALASSLYSMQVYDRVIPNYGLDTLWVLTFGVLLAIAMELLMKHVRALMVDRACKAIDEELSDVFFTRAMGIRMDKRPRTIGTFAAQIRMFEAVRNFLTSTTLFVLADLPFALVFVAIIAWIAGPLAWIPLLLLPVSLIVGLMFARPIARLTIQNAAESTLKNGLLIESIDGAETIKSLAAEPHFRKRWNDLTQLMSTSELETKSLTGLSSHLSQSIQQVSYASMVCAGVYAINAGTLTMGGLIACSIIAGRALNPFAQLAAVLVQWQHARAALLGLEPIVQLPGDNDVDEKLVVRPQSCRGEMRIEAVRHIYENDLEVLHVDALSIMPGERLAVIGQIGSGKTTLLKVLSGLYRPNAGRVFLDDVDMAFLEKMHVREHVHYLPQQARLFNGTLRENLLLGMADPGDDAVLRAATATGLVQFIKQHPRGLGLILSEGGQGLSGGQRQLVTLTRLLLLQPRVLLLDEPTAAIDGPLEEQVMQGLLLHAPEAAVVMVTHKASLLKLATRILVMDRGRVFMDGPRDAVLQALAKRQAGGATSADASTKALA